MLKNILKRMINEEFDKLKLEGRKIRLKTRTKRYIIYSVVIFMIFIITGIFPVVGNITSILLIFFIVKICMNTNVNAVISLAKKNPDIPVGDLIRKDLK